MADYPEGDARLVFTKTLKEFGFSDSQISGLLPQIIDWQAVYTPAQIVSDLLPTTSAYEERFSANKNRIKAGLAPLSPKEYLATENSYRATLKDAGLPSGFYDTPDDFAGFISNNTSPYEMKIRVDAAARAVKNATPEYKAALQELYGIDESMMVANMLDADRALPLIEKQAKAVEFGAAAKAQGLGVNTARFEQLAQQEGGTGYSPEQGFAAIASMLPQTQALANIYNQSYDQATAEQEVFGGAGLASAKRKRQKLGEMETSTFSGQSGLSAGSLKKNAAGSF